MRHIETIIYYLQINDNETLIGTRIIIQQLIVNFKIDWVSFDITFNSSPVEIVPFPEEDNRRALW